MTNKNPNVTTHGSATPSSQVTKAMATTTIYKSEQTSTAVFDGSSRTIAVKSDRTDVRLRYVPMQPKFPAK